MGVSGSIALASLPNVCDLSPCALRRIITEGCILSRGPSTVLGVISNAGLREGLCLAARTLRLNIPIIITVGVVSIIGGGKDGVGVSELSRRLNYGIIRVSTLGNANIGRTTRTIVTTTRSNADIVGRGFGRGIRTCLGRVRTGLSITRGRGEFCTVGLFRHSSGVNRVSSGLPGISSVIGGTRTRFSSSDRDVVAGRHCRCVTSVVSSYCMGGLGNGLSASSGVSEVMAGE